MQYMHLSVRGYPKGYYEESVGWELVGRVSQDKVKFLAGPFSVEQVEELRQLSRDRGARPLSIYYAIK